MIFSNVKICDKKLENLKSYIIFNTQYIYDVQGKEIEEGKKELNESNHQLELVGLKISEDKSELMRIGGDRG